MDVVVNGIWIPVYPLPQVEEEDVDAWQISGAMTNIIFRCQNLVTNQVNQLGITQKRPNACATFCQTNLILSIRCVSCLQYVLVRIFGTNDALFSRDAEQDIFRRVAQVGLGPKLLVSTAVEPVE